MAAGNHDSSSTIAVSATVFTPANLNETPAGGGGIKRVSFDEQQVRTFVYEDEHVDNASSASHTKPPFTDPDAPPSKVTVVAEHSEMPTTILPPSQIESSQNVAVSPPLPALVKRMENEIENPFRPEETLFHEVDPIVEAYKKKPYPPSLPGSLSSTPVKSPHPAYLNGISPSSLVMDRDVEKPVSDTTPLTSGEPCKDDKGVDSDLPQPSQVECVRLDKKKCGCCSVQ